MDNLRLIAKGAEADLWFDENWYGLSVIIKKREKKKYRVPKMDFEIRRTRTIREASIINRAKEAGVPTPIIYHLDPDHAIIIMEHIKGDKVRDLVNRLSTNERRALFKEIGEKAGLLHKAGIVHGDLTTSNIIFSEGRVVFIDFGLADASHETEGRGVDLNLMYRMLTSTHFEHTNELFEAFKEGYETAIENADEILKRMKEIARRGRYVER